MFCQSRQCLASKFIVFGIKNRISAAQKYENGLSRWTCVLRRKSAGTQLLGLRVRNPLGHGRFSLWFVVCCSGTGLCDEPIAYPEESSPVSVQVCVSVCVINNNNNNPLHLDWNRYKRFDKNIYNGKQFSAWIWRFGVCKIYAFFEYTCIYIFFKSWQTLGVNLFVSAPSFCPAEVTGLLWGPFVCLWLYVLCQQELPLFVLIPCKVTSTLRTRPT